MSDWWLVFNDENVVKLKTKDEMEARVFALVRGWRAIGFDHGATVYRVVCRHCRTPLRNGVCPNMCHDEEEP